MHFGFLSTINAPTLSDFIAGALKHGVTQISVICDAKEFSDKDRKITKQRTGTLFENPAHSISDIYQFSAQQGIPFYFVTDHNAPSTAQLIQDKQIDCLLNAGTPRKLGAEIIQATPFGIVNVHPGLLPKYRGSSAVEWALLNGDPLGNTAHFLTEAYDAGPIIEKEEYSFAPATPYQDMRSHIYTASFELAGRILAQIQAGTLSPDQLVKQNETEAQTWPPIPDSKMQQVLAKYGQAMTGNPDLGPNPRPMACEITTPRLRLTPLGPDHISDTYVGWLNDPDLMGFSQHGGRIHTQASCHDYAATFDHISRCLWAIETLDGTHIGNINAYLTPDQAIGDIGLLVGHGAGGQGYGLEAWQAAIAALFGHYGLRKVTGGCLATHQAMRQIMTRSGMCPDGTRHAHILHKDVPMDVVHMAIFAQDYIRSENITLGEITPPDWADKL